MKGYLQLENGMTFEGELFGKIQEKVIGEVVFNTSMTGYQEILTDPSYYGQIVTMTYPLIGNYGVNFDYEQSDSCKARGFIVKEVCYKPNNFNNEMTLPDYLESEDITALSGIDTRMLTKVLRNEGVMRGMITTHMMPKTKLIEILDEHDNSKSVFTVSTSNTYEIKGKKDAKHIVIYDYGIKTNIINMYKEKGLNLTIVPFDTKAEDVLKINPDAVFLSNGPGDPMDLPMCVEEIKKLIGKLPILGICLGHQLASLALGGTTKKLKFGHRGGNHSVKNLANERVFITSQNHGYVVDKLPKDVEVTYTHVNDGSIEGMRVRDKKIYTVQFHPEACPGPTDNGNVLDEILKVIE
ncbi:glutamine-hydrolyzing carbamoyl-phosphate synthase small subunit [Anaerofustis stercorihominis]|uniref:glutamine-hydrolyzing carbamoyl-phosphate synthase small subunit n=1 Tax=Anaerofustis stercorihominis TaxID=214853 RepID=UPI002672E15D|nr:glutamine-hydrolyzing carbamoyl-phosphate synthase small subunit [Anaerofustis stercorihominis]